MNCRALITTERDGYVGVLGIQGISEVRTNQWEVASFDSTIRFDWMNCRALITTERDGYVGLSGLRERISGRLLRSIRRLASIG